MPTELPPGTVGNLTAEQEAKLQEFWILLLKVFGVKLDALESAKEASTSASQENKKESKRRFGLFGRGKDSEDGTASEKSAEGITTNLASINISDTDDKTFGQHSGLWLNKITPILYCYAFYGRVSGMSRMLSSCLSLLSAGG